MWILSLLSVLGWLCYQANLKTKLVWQQLVFPHDSTQDTLHYLVNSVDPKSTALPSVLGQFFSQANLKAKLLRQQMVFV